MSQEKEFAGELTIIAKANEIGTSVETVLNGNGQAVKQALVDGVIAVIIQMAESNKDVPLMLTASALLQNVTTSISRGLADQVFKTESQSGKSELELITDLMQSMKASADPKVRTSDCDGCESLDKCFPMDEPAANKLPC